MLRGNLASLTFMGLQWTEIAFIPLWCSTLHYCSSTELDLNKIYSVLLQAIIDCSFTNSFPYQAKGFYSDF